MHEPRSTAAPGPRRGVPWRLIAVLPPFATTLAFTSAWMEWGSDFATVMARTIQLEFLVIHAALFLGVFILVPVRSTLFRWLRWVPIVLMAWLYLHGAYGLLGWMGVASIVAIFVGTYGGLFTRSRSKEAPSRGRRTTEIAVRWAVALFAYGLLSTAFDLPESVNEWSELRLSVAMGAAYFAVLSAVEATPLYPLIRGEQSLGLGTNQASSRQRRVR